MKTPVFAIDVGYGNTKYAYRAASGTVAAGMFPSLAPLAASRALAGYGEGVLKSRKVATVIVDQIEYEVGPDVSLTAAYGKTGRALADDYVLTNNYAALLFGAIHFAGVTHIDRLVLGLRQDLGAEGRVARPLVECRAELHDAAPLVNEQVGNPADKDERLVACAVTNFAGLWGNSL